MLQPSDHRENGEAKPLPERLPRPTVWPATLALGSTLLAFGVVTSWIISLAGLGLFLLGAGGWFEELRNDQLQ
ncbi:MAG: hypothetical protein ACRD3W_27470 [Terriglobales bacterium]